ncbi:MAG: excisionase [Burkholderiales bacterium PBB1]|nr:MAG: excisionase [Burkholderiales bacterium PBB1]
MSSLPPTDLPAASYSTAAVARRLGVSIPTIQRWVDQGYLKAWKTVGGHRRIDAASVEAFILSRDLPEGVRIAAQSAPIGLSVLVVDDNPDDRDLLTSLIETALPGAVVTLAENGFEGLLIVGQKAPDVLVTDIVMPHMNGFEMLRHIATQHAERPAVVIAVSSRTPQQFTELGDLPADVRFIPKPIDAPSFVATLQAAVSNASRLPH